MFSRMLDGLVARTAAPTAELRAWTGQERMGVVNAMTTEEHPTQALTDLTTLFRHFGRIDGLRVLYLGEGNNTAAALALALPRFPGTVLDLRTPPGVRRPWKRSDGARGDPAARPEEPGERLRRHLHHPLADHRHQQARPGLAAGVRAFQVASSCGATAPRPCSCTTSRPTAVRR